MHKDWTVGSVPILVHTDLDLTNDLALKADFMKKIQIAKNMGGDS